MVLQLFRQGERGNQVAFVEYHKIGNFAGLDFLEQFSIEIIQPAGSIHHQERNIGAPEYQTGFIDPGLAQVAVIVHARGIREQDRSQGQDFHGFGDWIRGGSFKIRDDGQVLASDGIDQR